MNVALLFERQARRVPDALALAWDEGQLSYGELLDLVRRFHVVLGTRGIERDHRVAILLPNDAAFAVALLGTLRRGAAAVVLSPAWAATDAARALAEADSSLLVTTRALAQAVGAEPARTLTVDDGAAMGALGAALRASALPDDQGPAVCDGGDVATILFSSGTTGTPKGVMLTHGNLAFNAESKIRYCGITPADRLAMVVPIAHCFGQNVVLLGALLGGASVRLYPRFEAGRLGAGIRDREVTMLFAAPTAFARLLALDDATLVTPLRYALSAAAALPAGLAARWRAVAGRPLAQGYGLTECSPFAVYDEAVPDTGRRVGRAIDGVEVRIANDAGDGFAAAGVAGEVVIRGPNVMAGYWRRPEATAAVLRDGWLHTGDVGMLDDAGALHLIDRLDDVINVAGFKAWPSDVERALLAHPAVREAAAFSLPDAARGAIVGAAVVLHDGEAVTSEEIIGRVARDLAGYQRPSSLIIVEALPRSASGKVLRRELSAECCATSRRSNPLSRESQQG